MTVITVFSTSVRAGVLAFGIGLAALVIPQLLDTAAAESSDAAPAATSTTDAARPAAAARPAGPKARVVRTARAGGSAASIPAPAPTAARTTADAPAATPATAWTPLSASPRYRSPERPAAAAPRPNETQLRGVDGTYVYFYNRTDQTLAVVQVPQGGLNDPEADPRFVAPGEKSDFYGDNSFEKKMDVRLRIYSATQDDTGAWRKDQMREIIAATNQWIGKPYAIVRLDPYYSSRPPRVYFNRELFKKFDINTNWFADYDLRGPIQSGQTGTFMLRLSDRDDDYKVFQIEVFKIPQGSIQDYTPGGNIFY